MNEQTQLKVHHVTAGDCEVVVYEDNRDTGDTAAATHSPPSLYMPLSSDHK